MLKNAAGRRELGRRGVRLWVREADRRLVTQPTAFFSTLLEVRMLWDGKREILATLFVQHPPGGQVDQCRFQWLSIRLGFIESRANLIETLR